MNILDRINALKELCLLSGREPKNYSVVIPTGPMAREFFDLVPSPISLPFGSFVKKGLADIMWVHNDDVNRVLESWSG